MEDPDRFQSKAKKLVKDYYNAFVYDPKNPNRQIVNDENIYVSAFTKVLGNWKALVATTNPDSLYFEVTYNGEFKETYVDHYEKAKNFVISDEQFEGYLYPTTVPAV